MTARKRPEGAGKLNAAERSLKYLRKLGYTAEVCEQYKAIVAGRGQQAKFKGGYRKDLFGFADIIAYDARATVAVQTTSRKQMSAHLRKYRGDTDVAARIYGWLAKAGRMFVIHGWEPLEVANKTKAGTHIRWHLTVRVVTFADLEELP